LNIAFDLIIEICEIESDATEKEKRGVLVQMQLIIFSRLFGLSG
jgi:hypothetical protein